MKGIGFMDAAFEVYNDRGYGLAEVFPQLGRTCPLELLLQVGLEWTSVTE